MVHTSIAELVPDLAVVVVERLKILVDVSDGTSEAQIEGPKNANIPTRKRGTATSMSSQLKRQGIVELFEWGKTPQEKRCLLYLYAILNYHRYSITSKVC